MKKLRLLVFIMTVGLLMLTACGKENQSDVTAEVVETDIEDKTEDEVDETQEVEEIEEPQFDWKAEYASIAKKWYNKHHNDTEFGYRLLYMNDDEIPELCLVGNLDGWFGVDIYTVTDNQVRAVCKDVFNGFGHYLVWYEKSGYLAYTSTGMGSGLDFYSMDGTSFIDGATMDGVVLSYQGQSIENYGSNVDQTDVSYTDENGDEKKLSYPAYYELNDIPDATEIKNFLHIEDLNEENMKYVTDETVSYEDICRELGGDADMTLPNTVIYANLLKSFKECVLSGNSDQLLYIASDLEAITFSEGMVFALYDINCDGIDELIIPDSIGAPDHSSKYVKYNVLFPIEDWEQAGSFSFNCYDPVTGNYATVSGGLGEYVAYYKNQNGVYECYDAYENESGDKYDAATDSYMEVNNYYHIVNEESVLIDEAEYNNQPAFRWNGLDINWQEINDENIGALY